MDGVDQRPEILHKAPLEDQEADEQWNQVDRRHRYLRPPGGKPGAADERIDGDRYGSIVTSFYGMVELWRMINSGLMVICCGSIISSDMNFCSTSAPSSCTAIHPSSSWF